MRIYLTIFLSILLVPFVTFAASTDVSVSDSAVITVGGYDLIVSGTASFDSITVNADNFTMILSKGASMTVTSTDRRSFTVSPDTYLESFGCGSSVSTLIVSNHVWDVAVTVTVTPSSSACSVGSSGSGGSSGGGGGGGGSVPTPVYVVIPGTDTTTTVPAETTPATTPAVTPTTISAVSATFTQTMKIGMSSADIKSLQQLLNSDPDTQIASSGVGSPGNETEYFGSLTKKAVQKFQKKYDIVSSGDENTTGYGLVGPGTRAKLAEVFAGGVSAPTAPTTTTGVSATFASGMGSGMSNTNIKRLQQLLNSDSDTQIASSGVGSPGNETEYFGSLTEKAVQKFQEKHGIAKKGDSGYGYVGPKTRAKIAEVFSGQTQTQTQTQSQTETLQAQIQQMLQQVEALQAQLNAI
ncbi:peptidoglycan-binding protein [Patescibacteria group bacterium]|nr:peptidoglycan-binding protein [Patescibacteria group bacterium]